MKQGLRRLSHDRLRYRGREVTDSDVVFIRELIAGHPGATRRALSKLLCEAWDWRQANGELRDMVCRSLMLELHRAGLIELPPLCVSLKELVPLSSRADGLLSGVGVCTELW